ncbi:metallophosphoesterase [Sphingomonas aliaeris]|uniref:metallophosphoesterase n=1 Tax=Sphingomonas aliaeris TaxID=2759526 RepID=UPI001CEC088A|nr:metallophosphoesterase [Sphingomonas aliaeris]
MASTIRIVRRPSVPTTPRARSTGGRLIYAIGDIHGCYEQFVALLEAIVADIASSVGDSAPLVILCGDYIDRGARSGDVMAALVWLERNAGVKTLLLKGNHEALLLDFLDHPAEGLRWLQRDGHWTLRSYGVALPDDLSTLVESDCRNLSYALTDRLPAAHLDLLKRLRIRAVYGDYLFVHAGLRPGVPIDKQTDEDCLWIREDFLDSKQRFEKIIVHGHSWTSAEPDITADRMGIDTGVYQTGVLTAVRLEGATVEIFQARRDIQAGNAMQTVTSDGENC